MKRIRHEIESSVGPRRPWNAAQTSESRSCLRCHKRKVRCDKGSPCANCSKGSFNCIYPSKDEEEQQGLSLKTISDRLAKLESASSANENSKPGTSSINHTSAQRVAQGNIATLQQSRKPWELLLKDNDGGGVKYVNNSNIADVLEDEMALRMSSTEPRIAVTPSTQHSPTVRTEGHSLLSSPSLHNSDHPAPQLALQLWSLYIKAVDPVLKVLHIPTAQSAIVSTILDPGSAEQSTLALAFAIYFAAVTAMDDEGAKALSVDRLALLKLYKNALDQLVLKTDVMNRPNITILQALAIYATCLRVHETGRGVWVLNGMALRLAQSIGLHRDGATLKLSPFETELRLRLWWQLCLLDSRAPEDHGFELTVDILNPGLRLPLNIDDSQMCPEMKQLPTDSPNWTEMSFSLLQIEAARLLHPVIGTAQEDSVDALSAIAQKRQMIQESMSLFYNKYAPVSQEDMHLSHLAQHHFSTACKKMQFILRLREEIYLQKAQHQPRTDYGDDSAFALAFEALRSSNSLLTSKGSSKFSWLFKTYTQWYALAYLLRRLHFSPDPPEAESIWPVIDSIFKLATGIPGQLEEGEDETAYGSIWRCLLLLRRQAQSSLPHRNTDFDVANQPQYMKDSAGATAGDADGENDTNITRSDPFQDLCYGSGQMVPLSFDFAIPGVPGLTEWNAVINDDYDNI